jgi:Na+/H+-dicarboxylate symporter
MKKIGLLPRIIIAIVMGILIGNVLPEAWVRVFVTFNYVFSQFLGFLIPLIIIGLVTPAIADIGRSAGRLLLLTVGLAYADTILAGLLAYGTGTVLFPHLIDTEASMAVEKAETLQPFFQLQIPAILDVMAALVSSFVVGIGIAYTNSPTLKNGFTEFRTIIEKTIQVAIIPLLPLYIFGIFLGMTYTGEAYHIIVVFAKIICIIFILHIVILLYEFLIAGGFARKNPLRLLLNMLPAYLTALGTSSSAATIPVTLRQTKKNGVSDEIAGFCVPLCATIHLSGSMMKLTCCALTVCLISGLPHDLPLFLHFIMLLAVCMVAAPGVPGGAVMAALGPMAGILGFSPEAQALMIALYIAMDSFGTACNVTGDGALAVIIDRLHKVK